MPISDDQTARRPAGEGDEQTYPGGHTAADIEAMDRFDAFEAGMSAAGGRWVLLAGDPRVGFDVIGPFDNQSVSEDHALHWEDSDWWPVEISDPKETARSDDAERLAELGHDHGLSVGGGEIEAGRRIATAPTPTAKVRAKRIDRLIDHYRIDQEVHADINLDDARRPLPFAAIGGESGARISTHRTFDEACEYLGEGVLEDGRVPEAVYDLDTGKRIDLHVTTPVVTRGEDQGIMVNPLTE